VGIAGAIVNTAVLALLTWRLGWSITAASAVATEVAIVNNYLLNDRFTFTSETSGTGRFLRFNAVALGGLLITVAAVSVLSGLLGVPLLLANAVALVLAVTWNFTGSVRWAWADRAASGHPVPTPMLASSST
jgi:putative flippase GtrA